MFRVAICDDNNDFIEYEKDLVCRFLSELTNNYICDSFDSGEAFLSLDKGIDKYDMVILDCKMANLDGVRTAEEIRKYNERIKILFSTDYYEFSRSACDFEPIGYLLKSSPDFEELLCRKIRMVYRKKADDDRFLTGFSGGSHRVNVRDVVYINSYDHYLHFYTLSDQGSNELIDHKKRARMDDVAAIVGDLFIRVNYSYMVNMMYITAIDSKGVTVSFGTGRLCIPIRRGERTLVEERFNKYLGAIEW